MWLFVNKPSQIKSPTRRAPPQQEHARPEGELRKNNPAIISLGFIILAQFAVQARRVVVQGGACPSKAVEAHGPRVCPSQLTRASQLLSGDERTRSEVRLGKVEDGRMPAASRRHERLVCAVHAPRNQRRGARIRQLLRSHADADVFKATGILICQSRMRAPAGRKARVVGAKC